MTDQNTAVSNLALALLAPDLARHPDKIAYLCNDETVSYRQLADAACRFAALLQQRGIGKGDNVMLVLLDSPVFVTAFLGTILAGAVAVPASTALTADDYVYILNDSASRLLLTSPNLASADCPLPQDPPRMIC